LASVLPYVIAIYKELDEAWSGGSRTTLSPVCGSRTQLLG